MNDLFFACKTCKLYIDAGYRWTTVLPPAIVRGKTLDPAALFEATEYWAGVEGDERLKQVLLEVHQFVQAHRRHGLFFGEYEQFHGLDARSLSWMEVGSEAQRIDGDHGKFGITEWSPRFFAEVLGYTDWSQVVERMQRTEETSWWFQNNELRFEGRQIFEYYVKRMADPK